MKNQVNAQQVNSTNVQSEQLAKQEDAVVERYHMAYGAPLRVWERTEDGWSSREWKRGEKAQYERDVLGYGSAEPL